MRQKAARRELCRSIRHLGSGIVSECHTQRDSLGRFMNPWEIPAEAVIYSRAKESMRSGSGPRLSITTGNTREAQALNL
jgi:hypothetical protein